MPLVIIILVLALAVLASRYALNHYEAALARGVRQKAPLAYTGEEIALAFLKHNSIEDVQVMEHNGVVTDYYDPRRRRLFLRREFKEGQSLAAWAVALHEAAHALQTGEALAEFNWRRTCIGMTRYIPTLAVILGVALMFLKVLPNFRVALLAIAAVSAAVMLLNIGTLAVERNANLRVRRFLDDQLGKYPEAQEQLEALLSSVALREVGDLVRSPRYFFFSALPGTSKSRPDKPVSADKKD